MFIPETCNAEGATGVLGAGRQVFVWGVASPVRSLSPEACAEARGVGSAHHMGPGQSGPLACAEDRESGVSWDPRKSSISGGSWNPWISRNPAPGARGVSRAPGAHGTVPGVVPGSWGGELLGAPPAETVPGTPVDPALPSATPCGWVLGFGPGSSGKASMAVDSTVPEECHSQRAMH